MHVYLLIENFCETNIKTERLIIFLTRKHGYGYWVWVQYIDKTTWYQSVFSLTTCKFSDS